MRNGQCPKCNSKTVYSKRGGVGSTHIHVYTGILSVAVEFDAFVCTTCGYFENYIANEDKLKDVAQKWDKVPVE